MKVSLHDSASSFLHSFTLQNVVNTTRTDGVPGLSIQLYHCLNRFLNSPIAGFSQHGPLHLLIFFFLPYHYCQLISHFSSSIRNLSIILPHSFSPVLSQSHLLRPPNISFYKASNITYISISNRE